jgi:hypothetical protein
MTVASFNPVMHCEKSRREIIHKEMRGCRLLASILFLRDAAAAKSHSPFRFGGERLRLELEESRFRGSSSHPSREAKTAKFTSAVFSYLQQTKEI